MVGSPEKAAGCRTTKNKARVDLKTTMSKQRIDNHYVAQGYLRRWAGADSRLSVFRTLVSHEAVPTWKRQSTRGVAYHQHLYSRHALGGVTDDFERWLAEDVDGPSNGVLERVNREERLTPSDWAILVRFFAASQTRTPANLLQRIPVWNRTIEGQIEGALRRSIERAERGETEPQPSREEVFPGIELPMRVRVRKNDDGTKGIVEAQVVQGRPLWLAEIKRLVVVTSEHLRSLSWTILRAPEADEWLTSDDPVTRVVLSPEGNVTFGAGWKTPGALLYLPLSPRHLLYTVVGAKVPLKYTEMNAESARVVQECTVRGAHRMVFATSQSEFVATVRPRRVDREAYDRDREEWQRWHEDQTRAEEDIQDPSTWPTDIPPIPYE